MPKPTGKLTLLRYQVEEAGKRAESTDPFYNYFDQACGEAGKAVARTRKPAVVVAVTGAGTRRIARRILPEGGR